MNQIGQTSASAGGGIALWENEGGAGSPLTGGFPGVDFVYLPQNVTYFSTLPNGAAVDGRYVEGASEGTLGPTDMFVAGCGATGCRPIPPAPPDPPS